VKQGLFFFCLSFAFSGAALLAVQLVEPDCLLLGGRAYYALSMPALLLLAGLCYGLAALVLNGCGTHTGGEIRTMSLELGQNTVEIRALLDTGNTLRDPVTGQAVLVVGADTALELLGLTRSQLEDPLGSVGALPGLRLVPYHSVGAKSFLLAMKLKNVKIGAWQGSTLVAFAPEGLSAEGAYQALTGGV